MWATCWERGNNLTLWISSNLYYFAFCLTGGFIEAGVLLCKRQQVDFTFLPQQGVLQPSGKFSQPAILICRWKTLHLRAKYSCSQRVFMFVFLQGLSVQTPWHTVCFFFIIRNKKHQTKAEKNIFVPESSAHSQMLKTKRGQRVTENKVKTAGRVNFGWITKPPGQRGKPH